MTPTLYTFGYLKGDWSRLDALMKEPGVVLIDIRFSAFSRVPGFNMTDFVKRFGSKYRHLKALGNENYKGGPIKLFDEMTGVSKVVALLKTNWRPVLMCACADAESCHRTVAAKKVVDAWGEPLEVVELGKVKREEPGLF